MYMTEEQIITSYKNAASKVKQVGILADLNLTSKDKIISVLEANGVKVKKPKSRKNYPRIEEHERKQIIDMYNDGVVYNEIGRIMNRTGANIYRFIKREIERGAIERNPNRKFKTQNKNE